MKKKNPARPAEIRTRAQLEALLETMAGLKLEEARLAACLDDALRAARAEFEPGLTRLREDLELRTASAAVWAEAQTEAFAGARSLALAHGTLGWRAGHPALKLLPEVTWDDALARAKAQAGARPYVRVREELNKQRLLADRVALGADGLERLGLQILQEQSFFVEPRLEVTAVADRERMAA